MLYKTFAPHILLQPYVERIWMLEGKAEPLTEDRKLIAPNGEARLMIIHKGRVRTTIENEIKQFHEGALAIVGQMTQASIVDPYTDFGTIGIEFRPFGAHRLFHISMHDIKNQFCDAAEVLNRQGGGTYDFRKRPGGEGGHRAQRTRPVPSHDAIRAAFQTMVLAIAEHHCFYF